jgi:hypothetical protein
VEHLVTRIIAIAQAHTPVAYALAFMFAAAEAFPVLGAVVPGSATIVGLGALVPTGALAFWPLVLATTAGAIAGDGLSYWLGHHYKAGVASVWPEPPSEPPCVGPGILCPTRGQSRHFRPFHPRCARFRPTDFRSRRHAGDTLL